MLSSREFEDDQLLNRPSLAILDESPRIIRVNPRHDELVSWLAFMRLRVNQVCIVLTYHYRQRSHRRAFLRRSRSPAWSSDLNGLHRMVMIIRG